MHDRVLAYIRRQPMMRAGDRVGLAVSGGGDSVALLRLMLELRDELGVVLAVVHFNHKIRGSDGDEDQGFVAALAGAHHLEFYSDSADAPRFARERHLSLEAAGRQLRYEFFRRLLAGPLASIATAHTMDDQAETVLLRLIRGAGTRGLAGIFPQLPVVASSSPRLSWRTSPPAVADAPAGAAPLPGAVVRPLLSTRRSELRDYLRGLGQPWREDASNFDLKHTRNRLRQELLPFIERQFNPSVVPVLAEMAEIARAEEDYWRTETLKLLPSSGDSRLDTPMLRSLPLALQRRLVREFAAAHRLNLEFQHVERLLDTARTLQPLESKELELPDVVAIFTGKELKLQSRSQSHGDRAGYEYRLGVPGEVRIAELGKLLKVSLVPAERVCSGYNEAHLLDLRRLAPELVVRNWQPGDRFWPAHARSPKKLKELLLRRRIQQPERALWPVVVSAGAIIWVPGLGAATEFQAGPGCREVAVIEEVIADHHPI